LRMDKLFQDHKNILISIQLNNYLVKNKFRNLQKLKRSVHSKFDQFHSNRQQMFEVQFLIFVNP